MFFVQKSNSGLAYEQAPKRAFCRKSKKYFKIAERSKFGEVNKEKERLNMLHAGILMSIMLPAMVIIGQIGLLITELMEERMHNKESAGKVNAHA